MEMSILSLGRSLLVNKLLINSCSFKILFVLTSNYTVLVVIIAFLVDEGRLSPLHSLDGVHMSSQYRRHCMNEQDRQDAT